MSGCRAQVKEFYCQKYFFFCFYCSLNWNIFNKSQFHHHLLPFIQFMRKLCLAHSNAPLIALRFILWHFFIFFFVLSYLRHFNSFCLFLWILWPYRRRCCYCFAIYLEFMRTTTMPSNHHIGMRIHLRITCYL